MINLLVEFIDTSRGFLIKTLIIGIGLNFFATDRYLTILLPANTLGDKYDELGISRSVLGRTIKDGGTVMVPLVTWE